MLALNYQESYQPQAPLLLVPVWEGEERASVPKELAAVLTTRMKAGDFSGKAKKHLVQFAAEASTEPVRVVFLGLGKTKSVDIDGLREAGALLAAAAHELKQATVSLWAARLDVAKHLRPLLEGYWFKNDERSFRKTGEANKELQESLTKKLTLVLPKQRWVRAQKELGEAQIITESVLWARYLGALPPAELTPARFVEEAKKMTKQHGGFSLKVFDKKELAAKGFGLISAVGMGSENEPQLLVVEWNPKKVKTAPLVLVGKGITFDTGGYNLKPTGFMEDMNLDMAGAAAVLSTLKTLAELKVAKRVVGLMALAENMVSGKAFKPSDILTSYAGKTVEVANTDAEGRLVLADAISYACKEYQPKALVDLATLTGACIVALGEFYAGLFGNNANFTRRVKAAAQESGEPVWELPVDKDFHEEMKSKIADLKNINDTRWGGACTAAAFLEEFVPEKVVWAHLDIAGPALRRGRRAYDAPFKGTGWGVQLLVALARKF